MPAPYQGTPACVVSLVSSTGPAPDLSADVVSVQTTKNLGEPSGRWTLQLLPRTDSQGRTWMERFRPQDFVEISLGYLNQGSIPVVMRGLVDNAYLDHQLDAYGRPMRVVTINGEDLGKGLTRKGLWMPSSIDPDLEQNVGGYYIALSKLFGTSVLTPAQIMAFIIQQLYVPDQITTLQGDVVQLEVLPKIQYTTELPNDGSFQILPGALSDNPGSIWNYFTYFQNPPFTELFLRDDPDAARLYWRFPPFYDAFGNFLGADFGAIKDVLPSVKTTAQLSAGILRLNVGQSDNEVISYYAVWPGNAGSSSSGPAIVRVPGTNPYADNTKLARYGFIPLMQEMTIVTLADTNTAQQFFNTTIPSYTDTCARLCQWAVQAFQDNDTYYSGQISLVGSPEYQIGSYVECYYDLKRGCWLPAPSGPNTHWRFYVQGVQHQFTRPQGQSEQTPIWTTTLTIARGITL